MNHEKKNPWQTLHSKEVYGNPWIKLEHHEVINPGGGEGIYGVVRFQNRATGVVVLDDENYTYLVGQYRYAIGAYSWEIPEGGAPLEEDPVEGAKRELEEETGLIAETWQPLLDMHMSNSVTDEYCCVYLATDIRQGSAHPEETEDLQLQRVPFQTAVDLVMKGEIKDAISVSAILKVAYQRVITK